MHMEAWLVGYVACMVGYVTFMYHELMHACFDVSSKGAVAFMTFFPICMIFVKACMVTKMDVHT